MAVNDQALCQPVHIRDIVEILGWCGKAVEIGAERGHILAASLDEILEML